MAQPQTIHRPTVGVIALVMIVGAVSRALVLWIGEPSALSNDMWLSAFVRVGLVMAALWAALPLLERIPHWLLKAAVVPVLILLLVQGKIRIVILAAGAYVIVVLLRPLMAKK
jgi:hypothetical protein